MGKEFPASYLNKRVRVCTRSGTILVGELQRIQEYRKYTLLVVNQGVNEMVVNFDHVQTIEES